MACNPPKYDDLGKDTKDLLNKNYYFGSVKLDGKTKAANGLEFNASGMHNSDTGKVNASLETKYKYSDYGVTFSEKWTTDNALTTEITIEDQLAKGLKFTFDTSFEPNSGKKSAKIKSAYRNEYTHSTADFDFDFAGPTIHGSTVLGYKGFLGGYQASYDTGNSKLIANNISLAYKSNDVVIHSAVDDGTRFSGSVHQKVNDKLDACALLKWSSEGNNSSLTLGTKYQIDKDASCKVKINNNLQVGLSYVQSLRPGVQFTFAGLINAKSLDQPGHKLGMGINLEA